MSSNAFASRLRDHIIGEPAVLGLVAVGADDLPDLDRLMRDDDVARWWPDYDMEDLVDYLAHAYVTPFRVVVTHETVGFLQVYHANRDDFWVRFGVPRETFGIDVAIGVASARNRGVGRGALRLMIQRLFEWPEVRRVQIDPDHRNGRAVRSFLAAGFGARANCPGYDGDTMTYMAIDREAAGVPNHAMGS